MLRTLPVGEQAGLAAVTAALTIALTFFDLESTFGTAALPPERVRKSTWWWGFLLANAALSVVLWIFLQSSSPFRSWNPWAYSLAAGLAYPALVRLKLATITLKDQKVPVGLDALYEGAREYVYARINVALKAERMARAQQLMAANDLKSLGRRVRFSIEFDSLMPQDEKVRQLGLLLEVLKDTTVDDDDKKQILAIALTNGGPILQEPAGTAVPTQ